MNYKRLLILLLLIAILVAVSTLDPVHEFLERGLKLASSFIIHHQAIGLLLFVLLSVLSAVAFFFSSAVLVPVAIHSWGRPATFLLLWGSWLLGAALSYWIGCHPGRRLAKWLIPARKVAKYEKKFATNTNFSLVVLFQLAVPSEIPGYVLGTLRYPIGKFLGACLISELPYTLATVYLGDAFLRRQYVLLFAIAAAAVLFSALGLHYLHKRIDK